MTAFVMLIAADSNKDNKNTIVNVNVKRAQIVDIELATDSNSDATISSENYQNYIM